MANKTEVQHSEIISGVLTGFLRFQELPDDTKKSFIDLLSYQVEKIKSHHLNLGEVTKVEALSELERKKSRKPYSPKEELVRVLTEAGLPPTKAAQIVNQGYWKAIRVLGNGLSSPNDLTRLESLRRRYSTPESDKGRKTKKLGNHSSPFE